MSLLKMYLFMVLFILKQREVSFTRVKKRNRDGEVIPVEYLERCNKYHDMWLDNISEDKIIIDGNVDIEENPTIVSSWMTEIHSWVISKVYKTTRSKLMSEDHHLTLLFKTQNYILF